MKNSRSNLTLFWISVLLLSALFQNCGNPKKFSSDSSSSGANPISATAPVESTAQSAPLEPPAEVPPESTQTPETTPPPVTSSPPPFTPSSATTMYTHTNPVEYMGQYGYTASGLAVNTSYKLSFITADSQQTTVYSTTIQTDDKGGEARFFALPANLARGEYQVGVYDLNGNLVSRYFALTVQ